MDVAALFEYRVWRTNEMEKWFLTMKKADFGAVAERFHISPIVARLIRNRDVVGEAEIERYLHGTTADLYDGMLMKDMERAVELLMAKMQSGRRIRVIGDYDIDGVNATYILKEGLSGLGARVDTDIPDRVRDGYGLNRMLVDRAIEDGIDTIVTCDNGIAASKEIAYGKQKGLTIIVTDHHEVPFLATECGKEYVLPPADAVVDPKQPGCAYPFRELCGAAVAYKLVEALYKVMGRDAKEIEYLIENVAIATVGDVMDLIGENRVFVKQGLEMLKETENPGLQALIECTGVARERLSAYHIGYILGPCMNAGGRLDTAKRTLALLEARSRKEAMVLAEDLKALNDSRKEMTEKGVAQAVQMIENSSLLEDRVLVVYLPDCHESIAGIIAGRIRERYFRPVFVLTRAKEGVKGSGRSIETYHMFEELSKCSSLFSVFGGHKMAAGVSLPEKNVERFREAINQICTLTTEDMIEKIKIDMQLPFSYITEELVKELDLLEPFGKGNRKPIFVGKQIKVIAPKIVGKNQNVLKFMVQDEFGNQMDAVYFGDAKQCLNDIQKKGDMAFTFYPGINEYMGRRSLQLTILNYQ